MSTLHALAAAATSRLRSVCISRSFGKNISLFSAVHHACGMPRSEGPHLFLARRSVDASRRLSCSRHFVGNLKDCIAEEKRTILGKETDDFLAGGITTLPSVERHGGFSPYIVQRLLLTHLLSCPLLPNNKLLRLTLSSLAIVRSSSRG